MRSLDRLMTQVIATIGSVTATATLDKNILAGCRGLGNVDTGQILFGAAQGWLEPGAAILGCHLDIQRQHAQGRNLPLQSMGPRLPP
jgi:hypothetical protein